MFELLMLLLQAAGELLLQLFVEALVELGSHSVAEPLRRPPNPWLAVLGYALLGAALGGLSLLVFPAYFTPPGMARIANLVLTPVAVGGCMMSSGAWRARRGEALLRIDKFSYGYDFAFSLALVRFLFAK
jgi:hypothetical protein